MRIYDRELECGCMISSDGGGGLIPCCYPGFGATEKELTGCEESWNKWKKTDDYEEHCREVQERNK